MALVTNNEVLQAVIFAENFDSNFGPITFTQPKLLMPLVNKPIIGYTLDMLARSKIQETFIFCNQHSQQIKDFLNEYNSKQMNKMNIQIFVSDEYTNMGAVIRALDTKGFIKSNFVLINGDCIGNLKLNKLINVHKQNVQNDPGCIMTSVFRKVSPKHRIRSVENDVVLLLDDKKKIVFFEKNSLKKNVEVPVTLFENNTISVHYDLLDTQICICSDKVPPDFSDNFDFENREDFINGLLADAELLQHHIYAHILEDGYACRVSSLSIYESISKDIIQRFAFPIVPDMENDCSYRRYNVYLKDNVNIMNKSTIKQNVAIGRNTSIGSNSFISDSVIGPNCQIGDNVIITDSCIWENVVIEDNCHIQKSIICSNSILRKNSKINPNCVIASNVIIDENINVNSHTHLHIDEDMDSNTEVVGKNGKGSLYLVDEDLEIENNIDDDFDNSSISTNFSDTSDERCESPVDEFKFFFNEVYESLQRGIEEQLLAENLILEINSSKHAYNVPMKEVNSLVIKAILSLAQQEDGDFFTILKNYLKYMLPVIKNYIRSIESQDDCIYALEEFYFSNEDTITSLIFIKVIQYLYTENILDEDLIINWYTKPKILPDYEVEEQKKLRSQKEIIFFIKWLNEAEEESSSSEE